MTSAETTIESKGDESADRPKPDESKEARKRRLRGWLFTALFVVVAAAAGAAAARWYLVSSKYVTHRQRLCRRLVGAGDAADQRRRLERSGPRHADGQVRATRC